MARQSQIIQPSQDDLLRALTAGQGGIDTSAAVNSASKGEDLASTILKNKQAQEDRIRALKEKIDAAKRESAYKKSVAQGPIVANLGDKQVHANQTIQGLNPDQQQLSDIANFIPKEQAESALKENLLKTSEAGKLERARLRQEKDSMAPDKIKQLFQVGDQVMGVTYGGKVQPINAPGQLNPLKKTLPADASTQLGDFDTLSAQLERVKETNKPEFTGPLDARTGELAQTVDLPSVGLGASPERSDFYSNINSIRNQLLYLRSGKQINEQEYKRLLAELPNEKRSDVDFNAKLANFETVFNEIKANRRHALETGYNVPASTTPENATPPPAAGNPGKKSSFRVISVRPSPKG